MLRTSLGYDRAEQDEQQCCREQSFGHLEGPKAASLLFRRLPARIEKR